MHIRTFRDKEFSDFLVTIQGRLMQRSPFVFTPYIHIHAFVQFRLDCSKVTIHGSIVNRVGEGCGGQQHGCDCCE
jgi:hypothetical protein